MIKEYFLFSFRTFKHRKLRSWLTIIGIFIGIAAVVALIGLGEGLRSTINSQFGFLGADILRVTASGGFGPPGTGVVDPLTDKELNKIREVKGIVGVGGRIIESGTVVFNKKALVIPVLSMPEGDDREILEDLVNMKAQKGRLLRDDDKNLVVIGSHLLEEDHLGKRIKPGSDLEIHGKEFEIVGIADSTGNFLFDASVFMNENVMKDLFNRNKDEHDIIAVRFDQNSNLEVIISDIEGELRKVRDVKEGEEDFAVETPQSIIEGINSIVLGVQIFVYIIAAISILVGGIGIMNTMYTAVVERTKEIGIMKALGAKNSAIFSLFFIESGFLGAFGGVIGAFFGFLAAAGLSFIGRTFLGSDLITAQVTPGLMVSSVIFAFLIGSFFGTFPAIQASKLNPVDAIRKVK